jgi:hypothetical protein
MTKIEGAEMITLTREEAQKIMGALDYDAVAGNDNGIWKDLREVLRARLNEPTCPPCNENCNEGRDCPARKAQPECVCGEPNTAGVHRQDGPCYQQTEPEPAAWFTEDHREDKSATTYSKKMAERWKEKGWPVTPLYTAPPQRDVLGPVPCPVAWKNSAIRLGEELSSVGPDGYYDMTPQQWLDWALDQQPRGKDFLPLPPCKTGSQCVGGKCPQCVVPEPVGWIYEDDEGRMMFTQMPTSGLFWEPVYREKNNKGIE